ncbi:MAG: hypothetical protein WEC15_05955 [Flavobacteriales bacterium]
MKSALFIAIGSLILSGCGESDGTRNKAAVNFPDSVWVSRNSPDSSMKATVYYWRDADANFLAQERWCLGFEKNGIKWFIDHDLSDGKGSYEGGVFDLQWIDERRVRIFRRIDDQDANIVFDLDRNTYSLDSASVKTTNPQSFLHGQDFDLVFSAKNSGYPSSSKDTIRCVNWQLSMEQCSTALSKMQPISGEDWHHLFEHLPCQVVGTIDQANAKFQLTMNAGSWATVSDSFTTEYFGDLSGQSKAIFLTSAWDQSRDK